MTSGHASREETAWSLGVRLARGEIHSVDLVEASLERIRSRDDGINGFLHVEGERAFEAAERVDRSRSRGEPLHPFAGIPVAIKDNIVVQGMPLTCASRILDGYVSPYDATVVERLKRSGMIVLGKTNMDEFGMGSSSENSAFGPVRHPADPDKVAGGSSGGSAAVVSAGMVPLALGSDTGGSVRQPAAFCGLVGLKPTYGRVSRYGLVAFASSLDHIGTITRDVRDASILLLAIAGPDLKDSTSQAIEVPDFVGSLNQRVSGWAIGVIEESLAESLAPEVREGVERVLDAARALGMAVRTVPLPFLPFTLPAYYMLCTAEASSNLARYDGIRYGRREGNGSNLEELYTQTRSRGFGREVKRRILLGTYVLSRGYYKAYYEMALRARAHFTREIRRIFGEVDLLMAPSAPTTAFGIGEKMADPVEMYRSDVYTGLANLTGIPAISIPCGRGEGLPVGVQLMARPFDESRMISAAHALEGELHAGRG
jgi:aspartyl-tRNA(Asn)/glutamyl-tRNA(Gln) amidotransferase subunit A